MAPALALDGVHKLSLRPYQEELLADAAEAEARGCRRQLWVMATGLGKTVAFVALASKRGDRTLIIAHRDELIGQAAAKARQWWPDADIGIVKGARNDVGAQDIVVASVQSLSPARVARIGAFGLVVVDEAHHATSASYSRVLETLRAGEAGGPLLVGVTATPGRGDGKGLDKHFTEIIGNGGKGYDMLWGIRNGYLVDIRCKEVKLVNLRLEDVTVSRGDYADGALGTAMAQADAPWHIVKEWKELGRGRPTVSFHPTIAAAQEQAAEFMAQGVRAVNVSGVELEERRRALANLADGRLNVVTNAMVLTEGWDFPPLSCIIGGRPTKSVSLFTQIIGRGLRPYPGKEDLLYLDVVGATEKMDLCSVPSLLGVPKKKMLRGRTVTEALDEVEAEAAAAIPKPRAPRTTGDVVTRDIDLFKPRETGISRLAWKKANGVFSSSVGRVGVLMEPTGGDLWRVVTVEKGKRSLLMDRVPLALAQGIADEYARKAVPTSLGARIAGRRAPTDKQLAFAQRLGIGVPPGSSAGQVGALITARLKELDARKARTAR